MQMKLLNVALATALTAVLTGCGSSDGDATYNKQTVAPIGSGSSSMTDAEAKAKQAEAEAKKAEAEAKKAEAEAEKAKAEAEKAKAEGNKKDDGKTEGNKKDDGKTEGGKTDEQTPPVIEQPVLNPKDNTGNAANTNELNEKDVVVVQNYIRGTNTAFDTDINPDVAKDGNATVVGYNQLDNPVMSNIVVARTVLDGHKKEAYVGELAEAVYDYDYNIHGQLDLQGGEGASLQHRNISIVNYNENGASDFATLAAGPNTSKGEEAETSYYSPNGITFLTEEGAIKNDGYNIAKRPFTLKTRNYNPVDDTVDTLTYLSDGRALNATTVNTTGLKQQEADMQKLSKSAYQSGLIRTFSIGKSEQNSPESLDATFAATTGEPRFVIRGQEDQIYNVDKTGKVEVIHRTGAEMNDDNAVLNDPNRLRLENSTRIFGSLSTAVNSWNTNGSVGDVPLYKWDAVSGKLVSNKIPHDAAKEVFSLSDGTPNSYQLTAKDVNNDKDLILSLNNKFGDPNLHFNGGDQNAVNINRRKALRAASFNAKPIHLDHVQYGRVTFDADNNSVSKILEGFKKKDLATFTLSEKFTHKNGATKSSQDKKNVKVNQYFARGLQPSADMPTEGKVTYLGHALTYGLDNSYHKDDLLDSNAVSTRKREGIGNFVRAEADFASGTVEGSIYNIWLPNSDLPETAVEEDNLVTFKGDITKDHNSVIGTANLAYGNKEEGAFKGAFYGSKAAEFGGSVNSITEGYGPAKWGGVFGAKKVTDTKVSINNGVEVINK